MIKYLGSKRRLVPALSAIARSVAARSALDLFTGTTRVAQGFKSSGARVTAVDAARFAHMLARCYVATDATRVDIDELDRVLSHLDRVPGTAGYVTEVFCRQARYFQPHNGERIDAIRDSIARDWAGTDLEPVLLTSLIEAADRVDSTTGVQMAYLKRWAKRSYSPLRLRAPDLLAGDGIALRGDAVDLVTSSAFGSFDLAYLDPPYNQHRYTGNYHVWETLVAWDAPAHYGVACKRTELREAAHTSVFNRRNSMPEALRAVIDSLDARLVVVSCSNEGWVSAGEVAEWCARRGHVAVLGADSPRYVGARIGIHNPVGERVGEISHLRNTEHLVIAGERAAVTRATRAAAAALPLRPDSAIRVACP